MKFQLINKKTQLTINQHNKKYGIKYYHYSGELKITNDFKNSRLKPFIMCDGVIGFEKIGYLDYYEVPFYHLDREEWDVRFK